MKPTRRTQPYRGRKGPRGRTRAAMRRGKPAHLPNPQDRKRAAIKKRRRRRKRNPLYRAFGA